MRILDVGCGPDRKKEGSIGLDIRKGPKVDVVHDLNRYPYPFKDNWFGWIEMSHIIEHVAKPLQLLDEAHRIARNGATIRIITPHYTSQLSYGDFEHLHHFGYMTFKGLEKTGLFRITRHKIHFTDFFKAIGVSLWANFWPRRWEKYFAFIFPAMYVEVFLEVIKTGTKTDKLVSKYMY